MILKVNRNKEKSKLCLGSAQIGLNYGVLNSEGKIKDSQLIDIFKIMSEYNIYAIDTANSYGNAEEIIGKNFVEKMEFDIFTKISIGAIQDKKFKNFDFLNNLLMKSLQKLNISKIEGLLIHDPYEMKNNYSEFLIDWLVDIKKKNLVNKVGVSIYTRNDLKLFPLEILDIVQLPISIYDQKLINDGTISQLKGKGIDIHIRSLFLQGLLLESPKNWPDFMPQELKKHHERFILFLNKNNISLLEANLAYASSLKFANKIIFGITKKEELINICEVWEKLIKNTNLEIDFSTWLWRSDEFLDPRNWPKIKK